MSQLLVVVQIAGRRCALGAHDVKSVIELGAITPVPAHRRFHRRDSPRCAARSLTVIDCRRALGFDAALWPTDDRAAVVGSGGHSYALMVDGIEDITTATGESPVRFRAAFRPRMVTHRHRHDRNHDRPGTADRSACTDAPGRKARAAKSKVAA